MARQFPSSGWLRRLEELGDFDNESGFGNACGHILPSPVEYQSKTQYLTVEGMVIGILNQVASFTNDAETISNLNTGTSYKIVTEVAMKSVRQFHRKVLDISLAALPALSSRLEDEAAQELLHNGAIWETLTRAQNVDYIASELKLWPSNGFELLKDYHLLEIFAQQSYPSQVP